jgi:hypothetical protein
MKGFLTGLAARSTGNEPVLEPRRLLFEPREDAPLEPDVVPAPEPPAEPPRRREPAAPPARQPGPPIVPHVEPEKQETPREGGPAMDRAAPPRRPPPARIPLEPARKPSGPSQQAPDGAQEPVRAAADRPPARPHTPKTRPEAPRPLTTGRHEPTPAAQLRALRAPPPAAETSPAGERIVRITIGRVDVRAIPTLKESTDSRPPPAPKRMSLQEYLARGSRR